MPRHNSRGPEQHKFRDKLLLNQWLISLFGIDPLRMHKVNGKTVRPFHKLAEPIRDPRMEGLDSENIHNFYTNLVNSNIFWDWENRKLSREQLLLYEENIARHTKAINEKRERKIVWKYYQWLTLLFVEIYLDRFFGNRESLLAELNEHVERFNQHWKHPPKDTEDTDVAGKSFADLPPYSVDDLNKLCLQNATGSGKTLLMHVNLLQYRHYSEKYGKYNELSRVILLTPNEQLSRQHMAEFKESNISAADFAKGRGLGELFTQKAGLNRVDVLEITKLGDKPGPNTIVTQHLGDQNLLLVDEGHRGMSGKEEGTWFTRRSSLCAKGFTFEYSATFQEAVKASNNPDFENNYAKAVLFDYSYRWFYEDGFGKDYQILNLPKFYDEMQAVYLTACLLKFYQQLLIYEEKNHEFKGFNLEKPLWVFVGSTVSSGRMSNEEQLVATDVALIVQFIAEFISDQQASVRRIDEILTGNGQDTGLLDADGNDIFAGAFIYLSKKLIGDTGVESIYEDILSRLFHNEAGGNLALERIKGEAGEVVLRLGPSRVPFGLISVGDAKGLCDHIAELADQNNIHLDIRDSDFSEAMFSTVKDSTSPINLLIGSKKFIEGWDCWRVSTMGLMHVGKSEGTQIIQLFGRGVRLKGYEWFLKRSGHSHATHCPPHIEEIETLNVFGIQADFMERFREFLKEEGLPGNERRKKIEIPLNVTYDFGKKLKILRPKKKDSDGKEYDFKKDAPVPYLGHVPDYITGHTVVADWYPRIHALSSKGNAPAAQKDTAFFQQSQLALLDYDALFFELEQFKREKSWHNFNISKAGIVQLLQNRNWYTLYMPKRRMEPDDFNDVRLLQQVAESILKRYIEAYYKHCKREYIEPRLELRELSRDDDNIPDDEIYQIIVDGDEEQVITDILRMKKQLADNMEKLLKIGQLKACNFSRHLFQPLLHAKKESKITILPVALNEGEFEFVEDLKKWCDERETTLKNNSEEIFLLRNLSRGKGVGFFEAGNFHPDFILWVLAGKKQYITFIEPHGLIHEGPASEKILFHQRIKAVQQRMNDPDVILNSFILSRTHSAQLKLKWGESRESLENRHVLFMTEDKEEYIDKMFSRLREE